MNFRCKPFFHPNDSFKTVIAHSGGFIIDPGCVASEPVIMITGDRSITLMVRMQIIALTDADGKIIIDSCIVAENHKSNFYDDYLEPLFYDALNRNRGAQG